MNGSRRLIVLLLAATGLAGYVVWSDPNGFLASVTGVANPVATQVPKSAATKGDSPAATGAPLNPLSGMEASAFDEIVSPTKLRSRRQRPSTNPIMSCWPFPPMMPK
jgi:hypothetical protein